MRGEGGLGLIEGGLLFGAPYEGHIFLWEIVKQLADLGEVFDEASVEIGKPNETSDFFEGLGCSPIHNGLYLDWVHRNFAGADDQTEIVSR